MCTVRAHAHMASDNVTSGPFIFLTASVRYSPTGVKGDAKWTCSRLQAVSGLMFSFLFAGLQHGTMSHYWVI